MATISKVVCDVCGVEKGEGNKWFVCCGHKAAVWVGFWIGAVYPALMSTSTKLDICSEKCLHTLVDEVVLTLRKEDNGKANSTVDNQT